MPSTSLQAFDWNLGDVTRLEEAHEELNPDGQGRRALGHITRSALVMLCAAWELYFEDLIQEVVGVICDHTSDPAHLPVEVKKKIVQIAKADKDELGILHLAGDGWKKIYLDAAKRETQKLNTPKSEQLGILCKNFIGIENLSQEWTVGPDGINEIIVARGEIAHRGRDAKYITLNELLRYKNRIYFTALETDNFISNYLKEILDLRAKPWRNRALPNLMP